MKIDDIKALTNNLIDYVDNIYAKKSDITKVTNDLTDKLKNNYDSAYAHSQSKHAIVTAEENKINSITVNNTKLIPDINKNVNITFSESQLNNDDIIKIFDEVVKEIEAE